MSSNTNSRGRSTDQKNNVQQLCKISGAIKNFDDVSKQPLQTVSVIRNIADITGCDPNSLSIIADEYGPAIVQKAHTFLASCLGAIESASYLENFKVQLNYYRSLVADQKKKSVGKRNSNKDQTDMPRIFNFLLGRTGECRDTILPDYVLLEIIHNHNYVFVADADDIIQTQDIDKVLKYSVDSSQLFRICSAKCVACDYHIKQNGLSQYNSSEQNFHCPNCKECRELMSHRRYQTLRVIVTMYLLPLLSEANDMVKNTITSKRTGLNHSAMFALAGYTHYTNNRNYLGIQPSDQYCEALDVYDAPPCTDVLFERILLAMSSRDVNKNGIYNKVRQARKRRAKAISSEEWKTWLFAESPKNKDPVNIPVEKITGQQPDALNENTESKKESSISGNLVSPGPEDKSPPRVTRSQQVAAVVKDDWKKNRNGDFEKKAPEKAKTKDREKCVYSRKHQAKVRRTNTEAKSTKLMCESMGKRIYVKKPHALNNNEKKGIDDDDSVAKPESEQSEEDSLGTESASDDMPQSCGTLPYSALEEKHYMYNPEHHNEDTQDYYKGFQHLCKLRKENNATKGEYNQQASKLRFNDDAFERHFGSSSKSPQANTHELPRFDDQPNPIVGTKDMALSEKIVQSVLNIAETKPFLVGKASYVRAATTDPCCGYRVPPFPPHEEYHKEKEQQKLSQYDRMYPVMRLGQRDDGSARIYKGVEATHEEEELIELVNSFVKEVLGGDVPCDHNMAMMVISSMDYTFGGHSDHSIWHGKIDDNDSYRSKNGSPLPGEKEAYTLTMVITSSRHTKGAIEISWYDKTKADAENKDGKLLYRCTSTNNFVHFQFSGTQSDGIVHAGSKRTNNDVQSKNNSEEVVDENDGSVYEWRIVVSFRQTVSASACPACYLKRFDLLNMRKCHLNGASDKDWRCEIIQSIQDGESAPVYKGQCMPSNNEPDGVKDTDSNTKKNDNLLKEKDRYFLNHPKNRDQYKNASQEIVKSMEIPVQDTYLCKEACRSDTYNKFCYAEAMLKKCVVANVSYQIEVKEKDNDKQKAKKSNSRYRKLYTDNHDTADENGDSSTILPKNHKLKDGQKFTIEQFPPLLYRNRGNKGREYFLRDRIYNLDMVLRETKIRWDKKLGKSQELKPPMRTDDVRLFNAFILHREYKADEESMVDFFLRKESRWIKIIGSGGSPSKMDKGGADWGSILKDKQDVAHIAHCQYLNDMNTTLVNAAQWGRPVAVFVGKDVYKKIWKNDQLAGLKNTGRMVSFENDCLYFLGYFWSVKQYSKNGMSHDETKKYYAGRNYVDQQSNHRFREDAYFCLMLELIPDRLLDILPVWSDNFGRGGRGGLVHHGGQLREINIDYDPHERIRLPVLRENISKHLSLGIEKPSKDNKSN
jgi:hypothetical protein